MGEKHKLHNVRLDDEVWSAVKAMDCSLNQYLRSALVDFTFATKTIEPEKPVRDEPMDVRPKNCFCKHCGSRFAGPKYSTICSECKSSGHTLTPAECPVCTEGSAI